MKQIAIIFLFLFTLTQAGPAIYSLFADTASVFIAEEEKGSEKADVLEKKDKKEYLSIECAIQELSDKINIALHLAEKIQASPYLEKLTPPPNFC